MGGVTGRNGQGWCVSLCLFDSVMLAPDHCNDTAVPLPLCWARTRHCTLPWLGARGVRQLPAPHRRLSLWLFLAELSPCVCCVSGVSVVHYTCVQHRLHRPCDVWMHAWPPAAMRRELLHGRQATFSNTVILLGCGHLDCSGSSSSPL